MNSLLILIPFFLLSHRQRLGGQKKYHLLIHPQKGLFCPEQCSKMIFHERRPTCILTINPNYSWTWFVLTEFLSYVN